MKQEQKNGIALATALAVKTFTELSENDSIKEFENQANKFSNIENLFIAGVEQHPYGVYEFELQHKGSNAPQGFIYCYIDKEDCSYISHVNTNYAVMVNEQYQIVVLDFADLKTLSSHIVYFLSEKDDDGNADTLELFGLELETEFDDEQEQQDLKIENHNSIFI